MVGNAVFRSRVSKRLRVQATCKVSQNGVKSTIDISRYEVDVKPSAGFWAKRLENADQILQSLVQTTNDPLDDLAGSCTQLAITGLQLKIPDNESTYIKSIVDNKVSN